MPDRPNRSLHREIGRIAGPATLTIAAQPLYALTDTAIVSTLGSTALGGLAVALRLLAFATSTFIFLQFTTTSAIAHAQSSGHNNEAADLGIQTVWLAVVVGTVGAIVVGWAAPGLAGAVADGSVAANAGGYLGVAAWGIPATLILLATTGVMRGHGNVATPLAIALGVGLLNAALEIWWVLGAGYGLRASALGTVVAEWVGAVVGIVVTRRHVAGRARDITPDLGAIWRRAVDGLPILIRTLAFHVALLVPLAAAEDAGVATLAAYQLSISVWTFLAYFSEGPEVAGHILVARAVGRGDPKQLALTITSLLRWSVGVGVACGAAAAISRGGIAGRLAPDPSTAAATLVMLAWVAACQPFNAATFTLDGILVGAGRHTAMAVGAVAALAAIAVTTPVARHLGAANSAPMIGLASWIGVRLIAGAWIARPLSRSSSG